MGFFSSRVERETKYVLEGGEDVLLTLRQSILNDIAPTFIIATNRRLVIINNSFWGLYANHNIITTTRYNSIWYRQITSVVLAKGKIFSSVIVRLLGAFEKGIDPEKVTEGEIDGLWGEDALRLAQFLDEMLNTNRSVPARLQTPESNVKYPEDIHLKLYYAYKGVLQDRHTKIQEIGYDEAMRLIQSSDSKFVWLGTEPREYVGRILDVPEEKIVRLDPDEIEGISRTVLDTLHGYIFVCYNGNLSKFVSKYIKKEYNIDTYSLRGGVMKVAAATKMTN